MTENTQEKNFNSEEDNKKGAIAEVVFEYAGTLFFIMVLVFLVLTFFFRHVTVNGPSMNDTLQHQDHLIISCFLYTPQRGDIVVVSHGSNYNEPIIKRVIALPGQKLKINYNTGEVSVDGKVIDEPYIKGRTMSVMDSLVIPDVIPDGYVFVMGDNREDSIDSRSLRIGLIPVENIIGKAVFRVFPFESMGSV